MRKDSRERALSKVLGQAEQTGLGDICVTTRPGRDRITLA